MLMQGAWTALDARGESLALADAASHRSALQYRAAAWMPAAHDRVLTWLLLMLACDTHRSKAHASLGYEHYLQELSEETALPSAAGHDDPPPRRATAAALPSVRLSGTNPSGRLHTDGAVGLGGETLPLLSRFCGDAPTDDGILLYERYSGDYYADDEPCWSHDAIPLWETWPGLHDEPVGGEDSVAAGTPSAGVCPTFACGTAPEPLESDLHHHHHQYYDDDLEGLSAAEADAVMMGAVVLHLPAAEAGDASGGGADHSCGGTWKADSVTMRRLQQAFPGQGSGQFIPVITPLPLQDLGVRGAMQPPCILASPLKD